MKGVFLFFLAIPLAMNGGTLLPVTGIADTCSAIYSPYNTTEFRRINELYWINRRRGATDSALIYALRAMTMIGPSGNPNDRGRSYNQIGFIYRMRGEYDKALMYFNRALCLNDSIDFIRGVGRAHHNIGKVYALLKRDREALAAFSRARDSYGSLGMVRGQLLSLSEMGNIYKERGDYVKALEYLFECIEVREALNEERGRARVLRDIGEIYQERSYLEEALKYYSNSLADLQCTQGYEEVIRVGNEIGAIHVKEGAYTKALRYFLNSAELAKKHGNEKRMANSYSHLGQLYLQLYKEPDSLWMPVINHGGYKFNDLLEFSVEYLQKALPLHKKWNDQLQVSTTLLGLGKAYNIKKKWELALSACLESLDMAEKINAIVQVQDACLCLSETFKHLGNYQRSLAYYVRYTTTRDSIYTESNSRRMAKMNARYENDKKDREIKLLNSQNLINSLKLEKHNSQRAYLIGTTFFSLAILLLLYNRFRIKKRNHKILLDKNRLIERSLSEKSILLKEIHHRVKNNLQIISSILNLQSKHIDNETVKMAMKDGQNRIKSMALIHQKLFQEEELSTISIAEYIPLLVESLFRSYGIDQDQVELQSMVDDMDLDMDIIIPLGLIINELVSNSLQHAFGNQKKGKIKIVLQHRHDEIMLEVSDNGSGIPTAYDVEGSSSLGLKLVYSLAEKLKTFPRIVNDRGTTVQLSFTYPNPIYQNGKNKYSYR